ncbi:MAG: GatB/YqeY domain-containing protein [Patescibacteria group bacterium]
MMDNLKDQASKELVQAQKDKNETKVSTLRLFLSAAHNREIEKKGHGEDANLTDDDLSEILRREIKKRKESIEVYLKGNRPELAAKEQKELKILEDYLPPQLDSAAVEKIVQEAVDKILPAGPKDFGKVMNEAMKKLKGIADAGLVTKIIKEKIGL